MYREQKRTLYFPRTDVSIGLWQIKNQSPVNLHDHDFTELAIVESGKGLHQFGGDVLPIESGDLFVIPPGSRHAWVEAEKLTVTNVMISSMDDLPHIDDVRWHPGFEPLFMAEPNLENQKEGRGRLRLDIGQLKEVINITKHLDQALHDAESFPPALVNIKLLYLLSILCDAYVKAPSKNRQITLRASHVIRYIEDHYSEDISCDELAESMHASTATFYRLFRQATGTSPIQYINSVRLEHACDLLKESDKTVTTISFDVGFNDANYFSRYFRKEKGVSPLQYRKDHQ